MYWKEGVKNSLEWKHLKSSSANLPPSCCTRGLLLALPLTAANVATLSCFLLTLKHSETPGNFKSKIRTREQLKKKKKKKKLVWTATQTFPTLCRSKQLNSDFGFVVKDNYYATSQVVPGCPYLSLIIETIFLAFFRVIILKVGSLTSSTAWPPQCYTVPQMTGCRIDGSFAQEANSDTRGGKVQGCCLWLWRVWNDFQVVTQQKQNRWGHGSLLFSVGNNGSGKVNCCSFKQ